VVGTLRGDGVKQPLPSLDALPALARRVTSADVRISIDGDPEAVPSVVEVSAYRVVEHLLEILGDTPGAWVDARVKIGPDDVVVTVAGPLASGADQAETLAKVEARVALHEGRLEATTVDGTWQVIARIPVAAGVV